MDEKMTNSCIGALLSIAVLLPATVAWGEETWVDLTHALGSESIFWPTAEPFELRTDAAGITDAGYYYSAYSFTAAEHGGTHIDAPVHFAQGRMSVDQIPLSRLMGEAAVIDVSARTASDRDYQITVADISSWEEEYGPIPTGAILLFRTGFSRFWPDPVKYLGTDQRGQAGVEALHFPGLHPSAAEWLVRTRTVNSVGIDTASIDHGQSRSFGSHVMLMSANIPAFENVANLHRLPATGAWFIALPMKIEGGSGGPVRIVARLP